HEPHHRGDRGRRATKAWPSRVRAAASGTRRAGMSRGAALPPSAPAVPARWSDVEALSGEVEKGQRSAIAAALNLLDDRRDPARQAASELVARLGQLAGARGHVVGITGPPGSGKSSLSSALIGAWRSLSRTVGVLAVDPSSPKSGGALL